MYLEVKGSTACHSKICQFAILIIFSWRQLRNRQYRKDRHTYPFCLKATHKLPMREVHSWYREEENIFTTGGGDSMPRLILHKQGLLKWPSSSVSFVYFLVTSLQWATPESQIPFLCLFAFLQIYHLLLKWYRRSWVELIFLVFHFLPVKPSVSHKKY